LLPNRSIKWVATRRSALPTLAVVAVTLLTAFHVQSAIADDPTLSPTPPVTANAPAAVLASPPTQVPAAASLTAPAAQAAPDTLAAPAAAEAPAATPVQASPAVAPDKVSAPDAATVPSTPVVLPNTVAPAAPAQAVVNPAPIAAPPAITLLTPKDLRAANQITVRMMRIASSPIGTADAVSVWVNGDGSGASLRLRLLNVVAGPWANRDVTLQPSWISASRPINFTGWRQLVFPKASFTLKVPSEAALSIDPLLPADGQRPDSIPRVDRAWTDANAIVIETTVLSQSRIGLDDVSWATSDDKGGATPATLVDDFETGNVAAWKAVGSRDEQAAVSYGLKSAPGQAHGGKIALYYTAMTPAKRRTDVLMPLAQRIMKVTNSPYLVFTPSSLFQPILPSTLPEPTSIGSTLNINACAGQIEGGSFCVYSKVALTNVTVTADTDLNGLGLVIPKSALNINVVQVRKQLGPGILKDLNEVQIVPDLLVKDDRIVLTGTTPVVNLTGDPVTDIPADTTKQFWVTLTVPPDAKPGTYTAGLTVSGTGTDPFRVPISVTILPFRLLTASREYGINLRSRLDPAPGVLPTEDGGMLVTDFVTKDELNAQLTDIVNHGIRIVTVNSPLAELPDAIDSLKTTSTPGPFVYRGSDDPLQVAPSLKPSPYTGAYYLAPPEPLSQTESLFKALEKKKLQTLAYIPTPSDFTALQANLDVPIYYRDSDYPLQLIRSGGKRVSDKSDWWYWQPTGEEPAKNRVSAGFMLWRSNLYGAFIPVYQEAFGGDPYDETSSGAATDQAPLRPEMLTYPTSTGVIDSLRWEAVREGITDARYLTTFYDALRQCKDAKIAKPLTQEAEGYVTTFLSKPLAGLPETSLDTARGKIADYTIKLRAALDQNTATPLK